MTLRPSAVMALSEKSKSALSLSWVHTHIVLCGICAVRIRSTLHRILFGGCKTLLTECGPELSGTEPGQ